MANTVFNNTVLEAQATDLLTTKVNTRSLMTVDASLAESAGMKKTINVYTYTGAAEALAAGVGSTAANRGSIGYTGNDYTVLTIQQAFDYTDEDALKDPQIVEMMMNGATQVMANKLTADFYDAISKTANEHGITGSFSYDGIVDAIATLNVEDESGLFLLINPAQKADIRKDADYTAAQLGEVVYNGQIGTVAGIPVIVSKAVGAGTAYLATTAAVKCFMKKDVEIEQERDADKRTNSVYLRTYYLVSLVDDTKVCFIASNPSTTTTITTKSAGAKTIAGAATTGAVVKVYINGVFDGETTAAASAYSYTAKANLVADDAIKVVAQKTGQIKSIAVATAS